MKRLSIVVRFLPNIPGYWGHTTRPRRDRFRIDINASGSKQKQALVLLHEFVHVACWIFREEVTLKVEHELTRAVEGVFRMFLKIWKGKPKRT